MSDPIFIPLIFPTPEFINLSYSPKNIPTLKGKGIFDNGATNNEIPEATVDEKGIRLEFAQFGHFTSFDVIRSMVSMASVADADLPAPIATGLKTMHYVDSYVVKGVAYYYRIRVWRGNESFVSSEIKVMAGVLWNPSYLLNKPKLWIDCENVTVDSFDRISQATDISDSGYNYTQPIDNQKPIHVFEPSLNRKVIFFDGNDDNLVNLKAQAIARNISKFWAFAVYKKKSTDNAGQFRTILQFNRGDSSGANARIGVYAGFSTAANTGAISVRPTDGVASSVSKTGAVKSQVWTSLFSQWDGDAAQMSLSQDGVFNSSSASGIATTTSNTAPSVTPATIGCGAAGTSISKDSFADVYLACLVVGSGSTPTIEERQKLEGWAAHTYGLQVNLPDEHPYKNNPPLTDE